MLPCEDNGSVVKWYATDNFEEEEDAVDKVAPEVNTVKLAEIVKIREEIIRLDSKLDDISVTQVDQDAFLEAILSWIGVPITEGSLPANLNEMVNGKLAELGDALQRVHFDLQAQITQSLSQFPIIRKEIAELERKVVDRIKEEAAYSSNLKMTITTMASSLDNNVRYIQVIEKKLEKSQERIEKLEKRDQEASPFLSRLGQVFYGGIAFGTIFSGLALFYPEHALPEFGAFALATATYSFLFTRLKGK